MRRFNASKELKKLERRRLIFSGDSKSTNFLVPLFVVCAAVVFLAGTSFSLKIDNNDVSRDNLSVREENEVIDGLTINDDNGLSVYFTNDKNSFVLFNNMLFRIVRINGDGTVRLMATQSINKTDIDGISSEEFSYDFNLDIDTNLNNWFNYYFINNENVVRGIYDSGLYTGDEEINDLNNSSYNEKYVGLLSLKEYNLIFRYDNNWSFYLNNYDFNNVRHCVFNGIQTSCDNNFTYDVLPVINIKADNFSGDGSVDKPYQLIENDNIEE